MSKFHITPDYIKYLILYIAPAYVFELVQYIP